MSWKCPFCSGEVDFVSDGVEPMVLHTLPPCQKYVDEDALVFLRNVRLATVGPLPDDKDWPLPLQPGKPS